MLPRHAGGAPPASMLTAHHATDCRALTTSLPR
uniref:Uncharacterized protein n=1 Tax=Arundo donax TaxID=35708 RepID=A0A0A9ADV8_ARUDO